MSSVRNPWTINGEKAIYDNNWIQVTEFEVINPMAAKGFTEKFISKILPWAFYRWTMN